MSINIIITNTEYLTEYKNDVGFVSNLGDTAPNLQGSVMEQVKLIRRVQLTWGFKASSSASVSVTPIGGGLGQMTVSSGTFAGNGIGVGDGMQFLYVDNGGSVLLNFTVQSITGNTIIGLFGFSVPNSALNGFINASVQLRGTAPQNGLQYSFGLLDNNETFNVLSKVSNNSQAYYSDSIGLGFPVRSTAFVNLQRLGQYDDWRTGPVRARYVSNPQLWIQEFEIEHTFMIVPFFLDGELTNLQNNVIPPLLTGLNSLKYVFNAEFRTVLSNPNTAKPYQYEESLGSVAWFNENFNGFNLGYQINSVVYTEQATGNPASGLLIGTKTRVQIQVQALNRNFVSGDKVGAYVSYLPEQSEYTNTTLSDLQDNFLYDNAFQGAGGGGAVGQYFISNMSVFSPTGNLMSFFFDVEYSPTQKAFLSSAFNTKPIRFLIGVQLGDNTLSNTLSDRAILLADVELYDQSPDISDLMHVTKYDIYPHNEQIGIGVGSTDMVSWNEDGLVVDFTFDLNLNLSAFLNSLEFKIVAFNPITNQFWEIDSYSFSPATAVVSSGVQQIIDNTTRGYILKGGDQFNDVQISVGSQAFGIQNYNGRFAQKISWQDWIANNGVDTVFFNSNEPNNNFNNKSSNYSLLNNYEIRLAILGNVFGISPLNVSGVTDYLFLSPNIKVYDYDNDGNIPPTWSCLIETFDAVNLTPLNGSVLTGIDTLFRVTWTSVNAPITSLIGLWGINRIEITDQQGYAITEMSSLNLPLPTGQQLLKPSIGTLLDVTIVSGNVVFECLIDGSLITAGTNYNLSSRIHENAIPTEAKLTSPDNTPKDTSGTIDTKFQAP